MTYIEPLLSLLLLVLFVGYLRARTQRKFGLLLAGIVGLFVISWSPLDWLFSRPLDMWYPPKRISRGPAQAIVVLSSTVRGVRFYRPYALPDRETYERCRFAAWLYSQWKPLPVLACGGPGEKGQTAYSTTMRDLLERAGVPPEMIWTEEESHSTHENAVFGAKILKAHGVAAIALVVEAQSMLRAEACFKREGLTVVPAPSAYRDFGPLQDELIPSWKAIGRNEITLHEGMGLLWYRLHGWI